MRPIHTQKDEKILELLETHLVVTVQQISGEIQCSPNAVSCRLRRMVRNQKLRRVARGVYAKLKT